MSDEQAKHLVEQMSQAFPEAMVEGYKPLMPTMPNDEKDRHVAAAAVKTGTEAQSPDTFPSDLFDLEPSLMVNLLRRQARALSEESAEVLRRTPWGDSPGARLASSRACASTSPEQITRRLVESSNQHSDELRHTPYGHSRLGAFFEQWLRYLGSWHNVLHHLPTHDFET